MEIQHINISNFLQSSRMSTSTRNLRLFSL